MARENVLHKLDETDRKIINETQGGFPLTDTPYADVAAAIGIAEQDLMDRVARLVDIGALSRFGPLYNAEKMGGGLTLAAMEVPEDRFDTVVEQVNAHAEVAHNYKREHALNMWFVLATEQPQQVQEVIQLIEQETGIKVYDMPKKQEFFLELKVMV